MIPHEVLDAMVRAGCTAEQIAEVVKAASVKSSGAERQARYRERKASLAVTSDVTERNSDVTSVTERNSDGGDVTPPFSDKERSPTPPKEINSIPPETKRGRGARLPADWVLPTKWGQWAVSEGWLEADVRFEADRFRDFWCSKAGKDAAKLDWEATWRNWIRSAKGRVTQRAQPPPKQKTAFQEHQEACREAMRKPKIGEFDEPQFARNHDAIDLEPRDWRSH